MVSASTPAPPKPTLRAAAVIGFALVHVAALGVFFVGFSWEGALLCLASYYVRMFAITAGFHRYFAHRTFKLGRPTQFLLAFLGQTSAQKGVLWWASLHRHHHKFSDQAEDIHSPLQRGFWWSHMGWILAKDYEDTDKSRIQDLVKFPELLWLDRNQFLATMLYGLGFYLAFGFTGLFWGYFLSTVLLWHGTFTINSVMHVFGRRVFRTNDQSRNSFIFALVTMGEGWHNNHHYYPGSASQGFLWWQVDASYYFLWLGEKLGIVKGLRRVPENVRELARVLNSKKDRLSGAMSTAFESASGIVNGRIDMLNERIERLSREWTEMQSALRQGVLQRRADLEAGRVRAYQHLQELQADYQLAVSKAGAAAQKRIDEITEDMERTEKQLVEILEALLDTARSLPQASPA
jgi:stearoyl-CoA desaturase (delta-9 desaturase)